MKKVISIILSSAIFFGFSACSNIPRQRNNNVNPTAVATVINASTETNITNEAETIDTAVTANDVIFEDPHWQGCPLFVDDYNAIQWYVKAHPLGYDILLNPDQRYISQSDAISPLTEVVDYNNNPTFWYPFPAMIGSSSNKVLIYREGHYIVIQGEHEETSKYHVHWGFHKVHSDDEILFTEDASFIFYENTVAMYCWGTKRMEQKIPSGSIFIDTNQNLGLIFYNESRKEMYIVSTDTCTLSTVKDVSCVITANYRADSIYDFPLILTTDGKTLICFGDKYNPTLAKLYDDTDLPKDIDFGDNVMKEPKFSENNIPWAGDTGL